MLPRAALRAVRPSRAQSSGVRSSITSTSLGTRAYASDGRPKRPPPPPPHKSRPAAPRAPTPPKPGSVRQTSPGTSFPKDQTWQPKDGINFGGPAAATPTGAGAASETPASPIEGSRPEDSTARPSSPLEEDMKPQEPVAQQKDADEPVPGGIRDTTQNAQARAENTPPPPEPPVEPEGKPQPLPDLRQGIPSTFMAEYMSGKQGKAGAGQEEQAQTDRFDVERTPEEEGQKEGREREYDSERYQTSMDKRRAANFYYLYLSIFGASVLGAAYLGRPFGSKEEVPSGMPPEDAASWSPSSMYTRMRARMGNQLGYYTEPTFPKLLPEVPEGQRPPFTLVLSLEDLMIHSSWDREHGWRVSKRPGIDYFIRYLSQYYELVLFTSVPVSIADPVIKKLDPFHFIMWPLGREATKYEQGEYIKDLEYLNRPLSKTLIVDTHAPHVKNQPENAIILPKWSGDPKDPHTKDLVGLIPFLEYVATMGTDDVRNVVKSFEGQDIPQEFARREGEARKKFNEQLAAERSKAPKRSLGSVFGSSLGIKPTPGMGGGMVLADGQSVAEGLAQGKMLSDQIREQGQKQYEFLEKQIRENGAQWLKEEEEEQKKMMDAQMKEMKSGAFSWFGGGKKD